MSVLKRGAEAVLELKEENGKTVVKRRVKKGYRVDQLDDKIRKRRTRREERLMVKSGRLGVDTPRIIKREKFVLEMEYIDCPPLKEELESYPPAERKKICRKIGESAARLHSSEIIHGDLTTSNMIYWKNKGRLYFIDFGLGRNSKRTEDQATDLFLLLEALRSTHFQVFEESWEVILKAYEQNYSHAGKVLNRLERIKKRRRYKGK